MRARKMQLPIMLSEQLKERGDPWRVELRSYVRAATDDLAWTRRENGDPVANCGHFGGAVLVKTWDGEQTDDTGSQD